MTDYVWRDWNGNEIDSDWSMANHVKEMFHDGNVPVVDAFKKWLGESYTVWDALCENLNDALTDFAKELMDMHPEMLEELTGYALYEVTYTRVDKRSE